MPELALPHDVDLDVVAEPSRRMAGAVIFAATTGAFFSVTPALVTAMGVFLKSIAADFGWSRTAVAGALTACALGTAIMCPFAGLLADRFGARRVALGGSVALALTILAISQVPAIPIVYYALFFLAGVVGALPNSLAFTRIIAGWFDRSRGLWIGVSGGIGYGGGSFAFAVISAGMLVHFGWRGGFFVIAALMLLLAFPILFFWLREAPPRLTLAGDKAPETGLTLKQAVRMPVFWWMFTVFPLGSGCMTAMFTAIVPILTDRSFSLGDAIIVVQAFAFSCILAEPLAGWLADRASRPWILAPLFLVAALGMALLVYAKTMPLLLLSGILMGLGAGMEFTILLYMVTRYFGLAEFGKIAGVYLAGTLAFGAVVPLLLNMSFDATGHYDGAIYGIIAVLIYSCCAIVTFGPYRYGHTGK